MLVLSGPSAGGSSSFRGSVPKIKARSGC